MHAQNCLTQTDIATRCRNESDTRRVTIAASGCTRYPAIMADRMDPETRQRVTRAGAAALNASLTPEQRSESARRAVAHANSPAGRARSIVRRWPELSRAERAEVRKILREGGVN